MAAYRWMDDLSYLRGRLPVWDPLWAQRSVTSMGSLYLFLLHRYRKNENHLLE